MSDPSINFKRVPNGGFPNIHKIDTRETDTGRKTKKASVDINRGIVNIRDILLHKRHTDPYLSIDLGK